MAEGEIGHASDGSTASKVLQVVIRNRDSTSQKVEQIHSHCGATKAVGGLFNKESRKLVLFEPVGGEGIGMLFGRVDRRQAHGDFRMVEHQPQLP